MDRILTPISGGRTGALLGLYLSVGLGLTACGPQETDRRTSGIPDNDSGRTILRVAYEREIDVLNAFTSQNLVDIAFSMVEGLVTSNEHNAYIPVLVMFVLALGFAVALLVASWVIGKKSPSNPVKDAAYECGMPPVTDAHQRFSVKFYLVALLFVLFDIEVVFLYPWAVRFNSEPKQMAFLLAEMVVFIGILFLGWYYVIRKGAVNWAED